MATIKPILDKVVVKIEKSAEATQNGIILPSTSKDQPIIAKVLSRGPGGMIDGKEVKMYVNEGDKVLVNKYAGTEITLDGKKYLIIKQTDILAMIC